MVVVPTLTRGQEATHQLFRESSLVANLRLPHMCITELTSRGEWRPTMTRRQMPHNRDGTPPMARRRSASTSSGTKDSCSGSGKSGLLPDLARTSTLTCCYA
jgi:hypothetical protein